MAISAFVERFGLQSLLTLTVMEVRVEQTLQDIFGALPRIH
jgi:hypothetical protein